MLGALHEKALLPKSVLTRKSMTEIFSLHRHVFVTHNMHTN